MSAELSGYVATLSGHVASLQQVQSFIDQQILLRPDIAAFGQYQSAVNAQLDSIEDMVEAIQLNVSVLQNLIINTNIQLAALSTGLAGINSGIFTLTTGVAYINIILTGHIFEDLGSVHTGGGFP